MTTPLATVRELGTDYIDACLLPTAGLTSLDLFDAWNAMEDLVWRRQCHNIGLVRPTTDEVDALVATASIRPAIVLCNSTSAARSHATRNDVHITVDWQDHDVARVSRKYTGRYTMGLLRAWCRVNGFGGIMSSYDDSHPAVDNVKALNDLVEGGDV